MTLRDMDGNVFTDMKSEAIITIMKEKHKTHYYDKQSRLRSRLKRLDNLTLFKASDMDIIHYNWNRIIAKIMG